MIFITGCTGLLGSHLVAEIIKGQKSKVKSQIKLLCRKNSDLSLLKNVLSRYDFDEIPNNIEFVYGDILDYDVLEETMRDVDSESENWIYSGSYG